MSAHEPVLCEDASDYDPFAWSGQVLNHFARGEQAIGSLCRALGLPGGMGSLGSLEQLRKLLANNQDRKASALEKRVERWLKNRAYRNLLAHATITTLFDKEGQQFIVTRHLPVDVDDISPDRVWTYLEQKELLRQARNDGRSISDLVQNILDDKPLMGRLKKP